MRCAKRGNSCASLRVIARIPCTARRDSAGRGIASALQAMTTLTDHDIYLFKEGSHARLYEKLGCHFTTGDTAHFAVWAPNARAVSVIGDFNGWDATANELKPRWDGSGIWE